MIERRLNRRHAVAHRHLQRRAEGYPRAAVPNHLPGFLAQMRAMDELVARPQQPGATERNQGLGIHPDMENRSYTGLPGIGEDLRIDAGAEGQRQQLILRVEIARLEPRDVLRVPRAWPRPPRIRE